MAGPYARRQALLAIVSSWSAQERHFDRADIFSHRRIRGRAISDARHSTAGRPRPALGGCLDVPSLRSRGRAYRTSRGERPGATESALRGAIAFGAVASYQTWASSWESGRGTRSTGMPPAEDSLE